MKRKKLKKVARKDPKRYSVKIKCCECGKTRMVQPQDKHLVTRCEKHQAEHRKKLKRESMRRKRKADRERKVAAKKTSRRKIAA